ncbi:glycosyltransferase [Microbacterium sp. A94]|uniref:glycosyltransferase n=1 Tax=Microbacterium sp. A94 TaxID=3450717 RepID=UPI003F438364
MIASPKVSVVMAVYNDQEYVAAALESCLSQTLHEIEVICVDDASTDDTVSIIESVQQRDPRVRLIRQPQNLSAFQARRVGVNTASAPFILFLDGDDELAPAAAKVALARATSTGADVVGFGVEVIAAQGGFPAKMEAALQPEYDLLGGEDIVTKLLPAGESPNGHLWRYLFSTAVLRRAYEGFSDDETYYRANDLPITFLALSLADKYSSIPERLYKYFFRRGTSGHAVDGMEQFRFTLSGVDPINAIATTVQRIAKRSHAEAGIWECYESARLHVIAQILRYCIRDTSGALQGDCIALLNEHVGEVKVLRAAALAYPEALLTLSAHASAPTQPNGTVRNVLLTTRHLGTGGLQTVLLDQASRLIASGYQVTIAVFERVTPEAEVPDGVSLVQIARGPMEAQIEEWQTVCREHSIDMIVDHHLGYNQNWPWFALAALAIGTPTIGWQHTFALRPIFDRTERLSFLTSHVRLLLRLVTLSPTDVSFWKMRGVENVVFFPNPPSQLMLDGLNLSVPRGAPAGRLELVWWGRLDNSTKQVNHLVQVAQQLRSRQVDFRLTIIGPDSKQLTAAEVRQAAASRGVDDAIDLVGELRPSELIEITSRAHIFVSVSAIEGYQLTILEAQALGLPVVMYELPWLVPVRGNPGLISTPAGKPSEFADAIIRLASDDERYVAMSASAMTFVRSFAEDDITTRLRELLDGELAPEFSPAPTMADAQLIGDWLVRLAERNVAHADRSTGGGGTQVALLRRERDLVQRKLAQITAGPSFRIGRILTFVPRRLLGRHKGLVPESLRAGGRVIEPARSTSAAEMPTPLRATGAAPRMGNPDVTVVIPVYNSAPWLEDCIVSVLAQTDVSVQVIAVNDGSTDESLSILQRLAASDPRISVIDQSNSGQSVGRNKGIDAARGRYLIYLDSDDFWSNDALSSLVRRADQDFLDVLMFDCIVFRDGEVGEATWNKYSTYYRRARTYRQVGRGIDIMASMRSNRDYRPHVGLYMARTEFVRESGVRFIPGIVHQDNPYTFRLLLKANRASHESINAYARRIRPGSTITTLTPERSARGYYLSYLEMMREYEGALIPKEHLGAIQNILNSVYEGAANQFALIPDSVAEELRALDLAPDAQDVFLSLRKGVH